MPIASFGVSDVAASDSGSTANPSEDRDGTDSSGSTEQALDRGGEGFFVIRSARSHMHSYLSLELPVCLSFLSTSYEAFLMDKESMDDRICVGIGKHAKYTRAYVHEPA